MIAAGPCPEVLDRSHTCDHINEIVLGAAADDPIETWACAAQAVIWTKDSDFTDRAQRGPGLQVVWLRWGNTTNAALRARLAPHLRKIETALEAGEVLVEVR